MGLKRFGSDVSLFCRTWSMATDESGFKAQFKKDLMKAHLDALVWTNSDMFRAGLPDISALNRGAYYGIELKFVKNLPKRHDSKCLKHEVTGPQITFLEGVNNSGGHACVVIGFNDVAVVMFDLKPN